jgi:hypothetical protein
MNETRVYNPELLPKRGEMTAWALAVFASLGFYFLQAGGSAPLWSWILVLFLYFSALSISFGNWMDRHTRLTVSAEGAGFENGVRRVYLTWAQVRAVRTAPAKWGTKVQVLGESAHFEFNTLGEVEYGGEVRGRTGFRQGQTIMDEIIRAAGLLAVTKDEFFTTYSRPK